MLPELWASESLMQSSWWLFESPSAAFHTIALLQSCCWGKVASHCHPLSWLLLDTASVQQSRIQPSFLLHFACIHFFPPLEFLHHWCVLLSNEITDLLPGGSKIVFDQISCWGEMRWQPWWQGGCQWMPFVSTLSKFFATISCSILVAKLGRCSLVLGGLVLRLAYVFTRAHLWQFPDSTLAAVNLYRLCCRDGPGSATSDAPHHWWCLAESPNQAQPGTSLQIPWSLLLAPQRGRVLEATCGGDIPTL